MQNQSAELAQRRTPMISNQQSYQQKEFGTGNLVYK